MAKYCSVKKNEDIQTIKEYCKALDLTYAQAGSPKTMKELADNLGTTVADLRNPLGGHTSLTFKKNSYGNWSIQGDIDKGMSESQIIKKIMDRYSNIPHEQAKGIYDAVKKGGSGATADWSDRSKGFNPSSAKKNSVSDAERKVKEQSDWKSKADEIIAGVVKDFRMDENDEKDLREKLGIKKNAGPRKFCSKKSA